MSEDLKNVIKNIAILFAVLVLAYFLSTYFGVLYENLIGSLRGSFVDLRSVFGLPLSYAFLLTLLFTAFGGSKKYWWIGILLIPAVIFEVYFDLSHIYFPIILGLGGWLLGFLARKIFARQRD